MSTTQPVLRGCGRRKAGGCYAECGLSPFGRPLEEFLLDPPAPIPAQLKLAPQGVQLVERFGTWHVLDWVGEQHYPNVADFLEEVRRFGLSRRLPQSLEFVKLTEGSRIILAHRRAIIATGREVYRPPVMGTVGTGDIPEVPPAQVTYPCPKGIHDHEQPSPHGIPPMCAGLWWEDVEGGEAPMGTSRDSRRVNRSMPSFVYEAHRPPEGVPADRHLPGFFASFPIPNLAVVRDPVGNRHELTMQLARNSRLPVEEVDE